MDNVRKLHEIADDLLREASRLNMELQSLYGDRTDYTWFVEELSWQVRDCAERLSAPKKLGE